MSDREKLAYLIYRSGNGASIYYSKKLADHLIAHGVTVSSGKDNNVRTKWHPASKPPKIGGAYYVHTKSSWGDYVDIAYYTPRYKGYEDKYQGRKMWYKFDGEYGDYEITDVVHWMPLPELPGGDEP